MNALVACPVNTVAAVIKPPGSELEIRIEARRCQGAAAARHVVSRDGIDVPPTHRLQGGSMGYCMRWEAGGRRRHVERLSPASIALRRRSRARCPCPLSTEFRSTAESEHIVDYFRGWPLRPGRDQTRPAMRRSIDAFCRESARGRAAARRRARPGDTVSRASRSDAVTAHGTRRRSASIDSRPTSPRMARTIYFAEGLHTPVSAAPRAKRFADELLEEVLGIVTPQDAPFEHHAQYIDAVFAGPGEPRHGPIGISLGHAADRHVLGHAAGDASATRYGESFVARNVGLKSVWAGGSGESRSSSWTTTCMYLTGRMSRDFHPLSAIPGMANDDQHIWGSRN